MPRTIRWDAPHTPFTIHHVAALGVTRSALRTAVAAGRIVPLTRGVFISADALDSDVARRHVLTAIAHQIRRPTLIASHHTAALAWELEVDDPSAAAEAPTAFTAPVRPGVRSFVGSGFTVAVRELPAGQRTAHPSGLVVTSLPRTAVDVAATAQLPAALVVLDAAARRILADRVGGRRVRDHYTRSQSLRDASRPLHEVLAAAATPRTRAHLERVVSLADPRRESPLESFSFGQMILHNLPLPQLQVRIRSPLGDLYPDFLWAGARVIGEADGMVKYQRPEDLRREKLRQEALEALGYRFIRWTDRDIRRAPASVVARIAAAIEA